MGLKGETTIFLGNNKGIWPLTIIPLGKRVIGGVKRLPFSYEEHLSAYSSTLFYEGHKD